MLFCQSFLGSIIVVGWTYRLAQRASLKYWWKQSRRQEHGQTFQDFLGTNDRNKTHLHWPNWFFPQNFREQVRAAEASWWRLLHAPFESLWVNFLRGWQAILNTWLLTLPACFFWWFGWYDGWNNSFSKGYEQAAVGPLISWTGILLFIAAMFYVPMAQARQAATGEWRAFFQFRLVWSVIRKRWLSSIALALCYALFALPIAILKTAPIFIPNGDQAMEQWTKAQVLEYLNKYFFWSAAVVLPLYVILRLIAAHIYASGLLSAVKSGQVRMLDLAEVERDALWRLDLLHVQPPPTRHLFVRFIAWAGTRTGRFVGGFVLFWVWFAFIAQNFIAEFFNYHEMMGWLNQPLVQLPWFRLIPPAVQHPAQEIGLGLVVLAMVLALRSLVIKVKSVRAARHASSVS